MFPKEKDKKKKDRKRPAIVLRKKLDAEFSRFIRHRDKHICYTCGLQMEPKKSQCGHFAPRQYLGTRYDEINCHAQCYACNMVYNGQPTAFAAKLKIDYGEGIIELLDRKRKTLIKDFPYEYWISIYEERNKRNL